MKKTIFAIVALIIAFAFTSCKEESNLKPCTLSVTSVSEHTISGKCVYAPSKENKGYNLFIAFTENLSDNQLAKMIETYKECGALVENASFEFNKLASNQKYYILAVTYTERNGEIMINTIETLQQATQASNDDRITVETSDAEGGSAVLSVLTKEENYNDEIDFKYNDNVYMAKVKFIILDKEEDVASQGYYQEGKMVCPFPLAEITPEIPFINSFLGYDEESGNKYRVEIEVSVATSDFIDLPTLK